MDYKTIIAIVLVLVSAIATAIATYFMKKGDIVASVSSFIESVEGSGLLGEEKMQKVVDLLYEKVPAAFKPFLTKETLRTIAQGIFDQMDQYATKVEEEDKQKKG